MTSTWVVVKVRFRGERRWYFLSSGGRVSDRRIHASPIDTVERARSIANEVLDDDVVASRVDVDGRTIARLGEPTPPRPVYGPAGGYRYLVDARRGAGVFHVVDDGDRWGNVSEDVYTACHDEAQRAGLATNPLTIHGATSTISTHGLRFVQRADQPPRSGD